MKRALFFVICLLSNQIFGYKNFVLLSAPGSGKGTFSQYLVAQYGYVQICPGDIFRSEISAQTELGKKIQPIVDRGDYVDESIVCQLIADNLSRIIKQNKNFIIDGFPRSEVSFKFLHEYLKANNLIQDVCYVQFLAHDDVCARRIMGRQVCAHCFKVYNVSFVQPKNKINCDDCGAVLSLRKADTEEISKKRLDYFHTYIEPLVDMAKEFYNFVTIQAERSIDDLRMEYDKLIE